MEENKITYEDLKKFKGKTGYLLITSDTGNLLRKNNEIEYYIGFDQNETLNYMAELKKILPKNLKNKLQMTAVKIDDETTFNLLCRQTYSPYIRIIGKGILPVEEIIKCRDDVINNIRLDIIDAAQNGQPIFYAYIGQQNELYSKPLRGKKPVYSLYTKKPKHEIIEDYWVRFEIYFDDMWDNQPVRPFLYAIDDKPIYGQELMTAIEKVEDDLKFNNWKMYQA